VIFLCFSFIFAVKPDEALILLERFLPAGQLLVLSNNLIKDLKKSAAEMK
jgi:hypothetical protein